MIAPPAALAVLSAALALLSCVPGAAALDVRVTTVKAAEHGPSDPELQSLKVRLRRLVGYHSFRVIQSDQRVCTWRSTEEFAIPGGRRLFVMPKGMEEEAVLLQVRLLDGRRRLMDTDFRLRNRGTMLFGVGRDGRPEGGVLIIVLQAAEE